MLFLWSIGGEAFSVAAVAVAVAVAVAIEIHPTLYIC